MLYTSVLQAATSDSEAVTLEETIAPAAQTEGLATAGFDAEIKIGQPGVYSTVTLGIHCSSSVPLSEKDAAIDAHFQWAMDALQRNAAKINALRASVGQVGVWKLPGTQQEPKAAGATTQSIMAVAPPAPFDPASISDELPEDDLPAPTPFVMSADQLNAAVTLALGLK